MTLKQGYATLKIEKKKRTLILKELRLLDRENITAGIHKQEGQQLISDSGFKMIDLAVQNEFGNSWTLKKAVSFFKNGKWWHLKKGKKITIPATRFVSRIIQDPIERRNLIDNFKSEIYILLKYGKYGYSKTFSVYNAKDVIRNIGNYMKNQIKKGIDDKIFQPNAPMTQEIKGFDKRLYEKGNLYNAIRYRSKKARVSD